MNKKLPPKKKDGQGRGPRSMSGEFLDVTGAASLLGCTEKTIRARVTRQLLPFRRWGGRVVFLRAELLSFINQLPGCSALTAIENVAARHENGQGR